MRRSFEPEVASACFPRLERDFGPARPRITLPGLGGQLPVVCSMPNRVVSLPAPDRNRSAAFSRSSQLDRRAIDQDDLGLDVGVYARWPTPSASGSSPSMKTRSCRTETKSSGLIRWPAAAIRFPFWSRMSPLHRDRRIKVPASRPLAPPLSPPRDQGVEPSPRRAWRTSRWCARVRRSPRPCRSRASIVESKSARSPESACAGLAIIPASLRGAHRRWRRRAPRPSYPLLRARARDGFLLGSAPCPDDLGARRPGQSRP